MGAEVFGQINWLAVIVAAVVYFAIGAAWYMPVSPTSRIWMQAIGFAGHPEGQSPGGAIYLAPLVVHILLAAVTAALAKLLGVHTLADGLMLGLVLWLGFSLPNWVPASIFNPHAKQPVTLIAVNSTYHLLGMLAVGAIVSVWV
jgi:hypothetical protein